MSGMTFGAGEGVDVLLRVGAVLARLIFKILGDRSEVASVGDDLFLLLLLFVGLLFHRLLLTMHGISTFTFYLIAVTCATR